MLFVFNFFHVRGITFDSKFDFLQTTLHQNLFSHVSVFKVFEEAIQRGVINNCKKNKLQFPLLCALHQ